MTKNSLLELLATNQIGPLFEQLKAYRSRDLVLLQSQWNDLQHRRQIGTVSDEQADLEDARIRQSLLELIENTFSPAGTERPTATKSRRTPILAALIILVVLLIAWPLGRRFLPGSADDTAPRSLTLPAAPISIVSKQAGPITWQLLKAERTEMNPDHWLVRIEAKCIRPLYGQNVHDGTLHLRHQTDELAPFDVAFPFVEPGATGTGTFSFQVPKTWEKVKLVIYQQEYDHPQEASVEIGIRD